MPKVVDDGIGDLVGGEAVEAVAGQHAPGLVEQGQHGQVVDARARSPRTPHRSDVNDAGALVEGDVLPRDDPMDDPSWAARWSRALVLEPHEFVAERGPPGHGVWIERARDPRAVLAQHVLRVGLTAAATFAEASTGSSSRRRAPRRPALSAGSGRRAKGARAPDTHPRRSRAARSTSRSAGTRPSTGGPRTATAPVHLLEAPDVLDVRVGERVVVVVPVHPHAETLRLLGDHLRVLRDPLLAPLRELGEPYSSISRFEFSPSERSTSTSTQRPWQSNPFWYRSSNPVAPCSAGRRP